MQLKGRAKGTMIHSPVSGIYHRYWGNKTGNMQIKVISGAIKIC